MAMAMAAAEVNNVDIGGSPMELRRADADRGGGNVNVDAARVALAAGPRAGACSMALGMAATRAVAWTDGPWHGAWRSGV